MSGIRSIEDIRVRCEVNELTDCWRLRGNHRSTPVVWFPPLDKTTSIGVVVAFLKTGKAPGAGEVWHSSCGNSACANPDHRVKGNRSSQMLAAKIKRPPSVRARMSQAKLRISDEDIKNIRECGLTLEQICERWPISIGYASAVRAGRYRMSKNAPNASVFDWRPA